MNKPLNKLLLIFVLVFLLPLIFFTAYQISNLNKNEQVLTEIYDNQLEAILFSVNQYSQDLVDAWSRDINLALEDKSPDEKMINFLSDNEAVTYVLWADTALAKTKLWTIQEWPSEEVKDILIDSANAQKALIKRLQTFSRGGYERKEPLGRLKAEGLTNQSALVFLLNSDWASYQVCYLVFDPNLFITQSLAQKIQSVTQEKFIIAAYDEVSKAQISILDTIQGATPQKKPLWLIPDFSLGIELKGETIQSLAKKRTRNNLFILLGVDLILIFGIGLIYRNIKKEIQLAEIKSDFVSNVSHEIRTPLALISMFAETLEMGRVKSDEKKQEYYQIIQHEANRLSNIVNKILSFSKMEGGKIQYKLEQSDLTSMVQRVLDTYEYHLKSKGFTYNFIPNGALAPILADTDAVSEAVINLLDNAIKYSDEHKEITIRLGQKNEMAFVEVMDRGQGISTEHQKYVFDKFFRVPTGAVHNTKGTGLGLALVSRIMEAHQGSVELESTVGAGSTFRLLFPIIKVAS